MTSTVLTRFNRSIADTHTAREAEAARLNDLIGVALREVDEAFEGFEGSKSWMRFEFSIARPGGEKGEVVRFRLDEVTSADLSKETTMVECLDLDRPWVSPKGARLRNRHEYQRLPIDARLGQRVVEFVKWSLAEVEKRDRRWARKLAADKAREAKFQAELAKRGLEVDTVKGDTLKGAAESLRIGVYGSTLDVNIAVGPDRVGALLDALIAGGFIVVPAPKAGI